MTFALRPLALALFAVAVAFSGPAKAEFVSYQGDYVKNAQVRLQQLGYYNGVCDGITGPATGAAILAFQRDHNIPLTGVVNSQTYASLYPVTYAYYVPTYRTASYYAYPTYAAPVAANGYYYAAPVASSGYTYATPIAGYGYYAVPLR